MLNSFDKKNQFTYEVESNAKLPLLDMLLIRNNNNITATVYRKESNSNVYLHWMSISHLLDPKSLKKELTHIRTGFRNTNGYLNWVINQVFKQIKTNREIQIQIVTSQTKMKPRKPVTKQWLKNTMTKNIFL